MAYQISKHRQQLEQQLDAVKTKVQQANDSAIPIDLREYAIAAAVFLSHAELENYFVDVLDGLALVYSQAATDASKLPMKLRSHLITEKLGLESLASKLITRAGEQDVLTSVERWFTSPNAVLLTGVSPLCQISGANIYGEFRYPSIKNIERILRRIGIGDPKGALNRQGRRDVVALLESVASLRTSLAHTATLPGISVTDITNRIDELKVFAEAFDRVLYTQATTTLTDQNWRDIMC